MRWMTHGEPSGDWSWQRSLVPLYIVGLLIAGLLFRFGKLRPLPRTTERRQLLTAYYEADVIAVIGGGHLYARHRYNIAFLWLWFGLALAIIMRKPLVLLPQSFGPLPG